MFKNRKEPFNLFTLSRTFQLLFLIFSLSLLSFSLEPSDAQGRKRVDDFKSFESLCQNRDKLSSVTRHTVDFILFNMFAKNDCIESGKEFARRKYITPEFDRNSGALQTYISPPISDISPFRFAPNLTKLSLPVSVCDLRPLKYLPKLEELSITTDNELDFLDPLVNLNRFTLITDLVSDLRPLTTHTKLVTLSLSGDTISNISTLGDFHKQSYQWLMILG
jgi:hypothetical protein